MSHRPLLVIGVGNPDRGDDGIGPAVIDAIRSHPDLAGVETAVETTVVAGDLSDIVMTWTPDHEVVIVDAMIGSGPPGTVVAIDGLRDHLPVGPRSLSSHGFGLAETVQLAHTLGRLPHSLTIIAVQMDDADHLAPLSDAARTAVGDVVARIVAGAVRS